MIQPYEFPIDGVVNPSDELLREVLYEVHDGLDFWTQAPLNYTDMVIDHVYPRALGGEDNIFNLVPTHKSVNNKKKHKIDHNRILPVLYIVKINYSTKALRIYKKIKLSKLKNRFFTTANDSSRGFWYPDEDYSIWMFQRRVMLWDTYKDVCGTDKLWEILQAMFIKEKLLDKNGNVPDLELIKLSAIRIGIIQ